MTHFTPVSAFFGGALIGLSALLVWLFAGRIAGIAGILGGVFNRRPTDRLWRVAFIAGLILAPPLYAFVRPLPPLTVTHSTLILIIGGLVVGFGTRLGNGCTSGHGVCGVARLSKRSIVATAVFMASGATVVFLVRHAFGG
ncbi:MAG TPA: YeeE/YedE family protein [Methylovirgula sp.]